MFIQYHCLQLTKIKRIVSMGVNQLIENDKETSFLDENIFLVYVLMLAKFLPYCQQLNSTIIFFPVI